MEGEREVLDNNIVMHVCDKTLQARQELSKGCKALHRELQRVRIERESTRAETLRLAEEVRTCSRINNCSF